MRSLRYLMPCLALASAALLASGCATKVHGQWIYPPTADLTVEAKPQVTAAALES